MFGDRVSRMLGMESQSGSLLVYAFIGIATFGQICGARILVEPNTPTVAIWAIRLFAGIRNLVVVFALNNLDVVLVVADNPVDVKKLGTGVCEK